jgi:Secretion system C-terminal sorting domain
VNQTGSYSIVASANGCSIKSEPVNVLVYATNDPACTTGTEENELGWKVYPNPFSGSFVIESGAMNSERSMAFLYNAVGELISEVELNKSSRTTLHVKNPGFYVLQVHNGNSMKIFKLVGK